MTYIIGLVIASLLGMFGFIYASFKKDKISTNQLKLKSERLLNQPKLNNLPPVLPPKPPALPFPFAIFGILFSLLASFFGLLFFFRRNNQYRRQKSFFSQNTPNRKAPFFLNKSPQQQRYNNIFNNFLKKR